MPSQPVIVQFPHPGREHRPRGDVMGWNRGEHRRKFLKANGHYLDDGVLRHGPLTFWGEWEPQSRIIETYPLERVAEAWEPPSHVPWKCVAFRKGKGDLNLELHIVATGGYFACLTVSAAHVKYDAVPVLQKRADSSYCWLWLALWMVCSAGLRGVEGIALLFSLRGSASWFAITSGSFSVVY